LITDIDIVVFGLMPNDHLLGALLASAGVSFTPKRRFGGGNLGSVCFGTSNLASEELEVTVGLTTAVRHPTPAAEAASGRAGWQVCRDVEGARPVPWGSRSDGEDDHIFPRYLRIIAMVGDCKSASCNIGSGLGVKEW